MNLLVLIIVCKRWAVFDDVPSIWMASSAICVAASAVYRITAAQSYNNDQMDYNQSINSSNKITMYNYTRECAN